MTLNPGTNFRPAISPGDGYIVEFHNLLLVIEGLIVLFVLGLMVYIVIKFNSKANPSLQKQLTIPF